MKKREKVVAILLKTTPYFLYFSLNKLKKGFRLSAFGYKFGFSAIDSAINSAKT
jgi:hypothetical protein